MRVECGMHSLDGDMIRKMCSDKHSYSTKPYAKKIMRAVNADRKKRGEPPLHIYKCPICEHYHFTSQQRKEEPAKKKGGRRRGKRGNRN